MKLYDLLHLERHLPNLTYGFEIVKINREHSYFHEWSDVPYPEIDKISISYTNVFEEVNGATCSWVKIYRTVDRLIERLDNENQRYLADFEVIGTTLFVGLDS